VILAASMASTNYLIDQEVPTRLFTFIQTYIDSRYTFLLLLNIFLLIVGAMLDIFSALVLIVPLILPIATGYGVDPVHLGIIFLTNLQIGYCTPPVGLNLFLASYRFNKPITELYRSTLPFLALLLVTLIIITYFPWLSLALIHFAG
jgi:tripartite ATP-independent transporter DctM subunit